jgi:16S rRNA C967 or C1407 C5-methylase (RsmB/RsmF family)
MSLLVKKMEGIGIKGICSSRSMTKVFRWTKVGLTSHLLTFLEGWYSVTPEAIARHVADRFFAKLGPNALVIDAMAGVGGNAIQFALKFPVAFAFDLSYERLLLTKNNAAVYGVQNSLELVRGDATCLAKHWRVSSSVSCLRVDRRCCVSFPSLGWSRLCPTDNL